MINRIDLKRDAYNDLLNWKNNHNNKVLLVEGARQVGKTYLVKKFAEENYKNIIYINLLEESGEDLLDINEQIRKERLNGTLDRESTNSLKEMFKRYSNKFEDNEDCVVIIDEIQESYKIYNMIRQFAREFHTHFIMTGSYLGRVVMRKEFCISWICLTLILSRNFVDTCLCLGNQPIIYSQSQCFHHGKV